MPDINLTAEELDTLRSEYRSMGNTPMGQPPHFARLYDVLGKIIDAHPKPFTFGDRVIYSDVHPDRLGRFVVERPNHHAIILLDDETILTTSELARIRHAP